MKGTEEWHAAGQTSLWILGPGVLKHMFSYEECFKVRLVLVLPRPRPWPVPLRGEPRPKEYLGHLPPKPY